ncbi:MAG: DNA topoisomerase 2 [Pycnora praestabilis]|nr:MAG: DNA topoisomerase 2 [Pycnora praestabilis]
MDSLLEDSVLEDYAASSDNFSPILAMKPKAKAAPAKAAPKKTASTAKAAPKKMARTTLKTKATASKKRANPDTEDEQSGTEHNSANDESLLSVTPPSVKKQKKGPAPRKVGGKPLQLIENEVPTFDGPSDSRPKKGSEQYQKVELISNSLLTQLEHILKRPDTYIGSVERTDKHMWVYNTPTDMMEMRDVSYVPGLYKIFDEILVNAADNKQRDKNMDAVKVTIDREKGEISVWNNGRGIPIEIHDKEQIYVPELIFGHLLTSSNYDDDQQKVTGGRNGYGAKLCNVFSTEFILETADSRTNKKYKQTWTNNMSVIGKAKITDNKNDDFTKITFAPDFKKFGMSGMDDDFEALVKRRVYDLAGSGNGIKVTLNGERIKIRNFKQYMEMYTKAIKKESGDEATNDVSTIITDKPHERWEIGFAVSDGSFQQVSFVNSIATTSGGTHVNYISDQICTKLAEIVKKKDKGGVTLKTNQIRNHIFLFVNCLIVNPAFTSQTKEQLTTKTSSFGSKCTVSDEFLKKVAKTEVVNNILHFAQQKADQVLKKSDGSRRARMSNPKLVDANKAGTKDGHKCTLILTEGDSAKGLAMAGRSVVGPDVFGVFPLRGKLLNIRDATVDQISKNAEIQNIKNFLGLQHKKTYTDTKGLRYGHLLIMTDQDHDGSHIKGLLINFLQVAYPSLLKIPEFLKEFITPIVKVYKGDPKKPKSARSFFTMPEYEAWKEDHKEERGWEHKYYKGLGTSTTDDAQIYFRDLDKHLKEFHTMKDKEQELIELAFSRKKADERKEWLRQFKPGTYLDHSIMKISYTDFVNKELILFSMADNMRSIPSVVDGLKPGQRKVLFACFKRNLKKDMKVVELAGLVSGLTAYQHGEQSLQQTIVGLAQTFVGSNNVNCLEPSGNFGSRLQGGSDCASARYIYTRLSPFARRVFSALDEPLLTYNTDDERKIEPEIYCPIVPMILVNGAEGIGTGWSSSIPNYDPKDIVTNLRKRMKPGATKEIMLPMKPWFRGWNGDITDMGNDRWKFSGTIKQTGDNEVEITELPIRLWTQDFKDKLEEIIKAEKVPSFIKDYSDYNTHVKVHFIVQMEEKHMKIALEEGLEEKFKLSRSIATSNLVAFDPQGRIHKYASVLDILEEFYLVRIKFYEKRKQWQLAEMQKELEKMTNQARFIQMIIDGKLVVSKKKKTILVAELKQKNFKPFPKVAEAIKEGELEPIMENDDEAEEDAEIGASAYDYLLGMAIWSLTKERVEKLLQQIGDKESEIDALIKLSKEDLWTKDLDCFINEWELQLDEEAQRAKKVASLGRRASTKLKIGAKGPPARKVKNEGDDPDDFDFGAPKPKKPAVMHRVEPKQGLLGYLSKKSPPGKPFVKPGANALINALKSTTATSQPSDSQPELRIDGASDPISEGNDNPIAPVFEKARAAAAKVIAPIDLDESASEEEIARPAITRKPRAAAIKKIKYGGTSDSEGDNGDNLLGDVSNMVKGIGGGLGNQTSSTKPLFSTTMSRPGSSAGLPRVATKTTTKPIIDFSDDETDYSKLIPQSFPQKLAAKAAKDTLLPDDEDDSFDLITTKPALKATKTAPKSVVKPITKAAAAPRPKNPPAKRATPVPAPPKNGPFSPAAKAYAAKQAKANNKLSPALEDEADEVDAIANDILADGDTEMAESPPRAAAARPSRRAAAAVKAKPTYIVDDDSDEPTEDDDFSAEITESE